MKNVRRILVAIKDPGMKASPALAKAARLAQGFGAELTLFHAITMSVAAEPYMYRKGEFRRFERSAQQSRLERLERLAAPLRRQKLKVRVAAEWDYPAHEAIVRQARRIKADLIVAEAHAGRRLAPWLLRLTDWELLRTSPVPVLIVKSAGAWKRPGVLAAIDPMHAFAKPAGLDGVILKSGAKLAKALRGSLHVMHAYIPMHGRVTSIIGPGVEGFPEIATTTQQDAKQALERALRGLKIPRTRRHLVAGAPSAAIPRTAARLKASIVVMGAISRSALKRIVIGNTAERVLGDLPCDVLVVKPARFVTGVSRAKRRIRYTVATDMPMPF